MVKLASTCLIYHRQQRVMGHPILVHCFAGSGKTAVFLLIVAAMAEMKVGGQIPDIIEIAAHLSQQRKGILREKEHFKMSMQGVVKHAKDLLVKKGKILPELPSKKVTEDHGTNQDLGDLSQLSSQLGLVMRPSSSSSVGDNIPEATKQPQEASKKTSIFSSDLSKLADLSAVSPQKKKVTKQDFANSKGLKLESNPDDPLSQLDPLWSLK